MHPRNVGRFLCTITALAILASSASGGALLGDGAAVISGSTSFGPAIVEIGDIGAMSATVEWAVYEPGDFGTSVALGLPVAEDPSSDTEYVYAFEIFNASVGSTILSTFSVGLFSDVITNDTYKGWFTSAGGTTPDKAEFIPLGDPVGDLTNVKWTFSPSFLMPGAHSDYLLFTSPYAPGLKMSSLAGFTAARNAELPSPVVPEPSTFLLALVGGLGLWAGMARVRWRRV